MQGVDPAIYLSVTKQTLYQYDITASLKDEEEIEDIWWEKNWGMRDD